MDINRIIAFVVTSVVIYLLNKVIKFGFKILILCVGVAAFVYFTIPEMIPTIIDWGKNIVV